MMGEPGAGQELLDPRFPGEWLAAVGLSCFGPGRWRQGRFGWFYEHDGDLPKIHQLQDLLNDLGPEPEDPIWLLFSGQGRHNRASAARRLLEALDDVDMNDLRLSRFHRPRGDVAASWMIDETWRRPPGALSAGSEHEIPVIEAALALIAAYSEKLYEISTWIGRQRAVGWLWEIDITSRFDKDWNEIRPAPPLDAHMMVWRRVARLGEPHAGALGMGSVLKLTPPSWQRWVPVELNRMPALGEAAAAYLSRLPEDGDPVGIKEIGERLSFTHKDLATMMKKKEFPPARWLVNGKSAWSWSADINPWAEFFGPPERLRHDDQHEQ